MWAMQKLELLPQYISKRLLFCLTHCEDVKPAVRGMHKLLISLVPHHVFSCHLKSVHMSGELGMIGTVKCCQVHSIKMESLGVTSNRRRYVAGFWR